MARKAVRIKIEGEGDLTRFGYHLSKSTIARRRALGKAVKKYGWLSVFKKLNALMILQKRDKTNFRILRADRNWVKRRYSE